MPLYSYEKAPVKFDSRNVQLLHKDQIQISSKRKPLTLGDLVNGLKGDLHKLLSTSRLAAIIIPAILVVTGAFIIYNQVWPTFIQTVKDATGFYEDNNTPLVAGAYIALKERYSNPGAKYFAELKNSAEEQKLLFNDAVSAEYRGSFKLSIPSLGIKDINVAANVDSSVEEVYDKLLEGGLAHFEGTPLPLSNLPTYNTVIYGHSSAGDYYQRTKDPAASFSILSELKYGSEIIVNLEGKDYKYKFIKGKIVDANDLGILQGTRGQKIITLFTCYPNGNNSKRYVATARLIEE